MIRFHARQGRHLRYAALRMLLVLGGVTMLAACGTHAAVKPAAQPSAHPETTYKLIAPPGSPQYALKPGQSASLPTPLIGHFAPPVYPPSLARRGMPPVVITAHLVFGTDGRVQAVTIVADSFAAAAHALFEDAVIKAVHAWVFTPLVFTGTTGGGSAPVALHSEAKPFSLWFEFRFTMRDGKPVVESAKR
ncbi:MAG TPA: hypothetical protein VFJ87_06930 [Rhodanobacteraceae bacterium]|nr:hypothetical protein [Rhodanobacteraceae bacterium]